MSDELVTEVLQEVESKVLKNNQPVNDLEKLAASYGWRQDGKRSAEDYVKFALQKLPEANKRLESKDNELFKLSSMVEELTAHMQKQKEVAYQQAIKDLNQQRTQAIQAGDVKLVDEIEKQKQELQPAGKSENQQNGALHPAILSFEEKNAEWLNDDSLDALEMQDWMEHHAERLAKKFKLPIEDHMKRLEEDVRKKFSSYFESKAEPGNHSAQVESGSDGSTFKSGAKTFTFNDLSPTQKEVAKYLKDTGRMDYKKYIAQLVEFGDLK